MTATTTFTITLIRHGQTDCNTRRIIQGSVDTVLNSVGIQQAQILATALPMAEYSHIYTSNLKRAHQTARELLESVKGDPGSIRSDVRLRERSSGVFDGQHVSLYLEECRQASLQPDEYTPKDGETPEEVRARVIDFLENGLLAQVSTHCRVLVVSHGATIREAIKYFHSYGGASWETVENGDRVRSIPPNTSVNEFIVHLEEKEDAHGRRQKIKGVEAVRLHDVSHLGVELKHQALEQQRQNAHTV